MGISEPVEKELKVLEKLNPDHLDVADYMLHADQGAVFTVDMMAQAVLHRSMCLIRGFCDAIRNENFLCAAPLVRLQLDSLLRFYALTIVKDPHKTAFAVLAGTPLKKQFDREGKKMTDRYLVEKLSVELPWVSSVYKETSGFIHLSDKHIHNTHGNIDNANRAVEVCRSGYDFALADKLRIESIKCMIEITKQMLRYVYSWAKTKAEAGAARPAKVDGKVGCSERRDLASD